MPEAQSMKKLVFNGGDSVTVCPNRQPLLSNSPVTNRGETALGEENQAFMNITQNLQCLILKSLLVHIFYSALILEKVQLVLQSKLIK